MDVQHPITRIVHGPFEGEILTESRQRSSVATRWIVAAVAVLALGGAVYALVGTLQAAERTYQMEARV